MEHGQKLIYAAGLFDGEGCIGVYNTRTKSDKRAASYQLVARVTMRHPGPVKLLHELFGGGFGISKIGAKHYFAWKVTNRQAEAFLLAIKDCLIEKKEQAEVALEFCSVRREQRKSFDRTKKYPENVFKIRNEFIARLKEMKRETFSVASVQGGERKCI